MTKYTNEKNIQMLIYYLKENNIKKIIVNPGTMNMSFVASVQSDNYFELFSCVDERSACYMACGLAEESKEPVVLTCTGATASRNYMPGLTEAFYRKLPILTITCTPHLGNIGQNIPQMIDRRNELNDTYVFSTYVPPIKTADDEWSNIVSINNAILALKNKGGGPVHINLGTEVTKIFDVKELPSFRTIKRISYLDSLPNINDYRKIAIFIGNHSKFDESMIESIEEFCEKYNSVVLCDQTSNYSGKYKIFFNIISDQEKYNSPLNNFDLLIHIGNTSGSYMKIHASNVWRVNEDGMIRDTFKKLKIVFEMKEKYFFDKYNKLLKEKSPMSLFNSLSKEYEELQLLIERMDLPFSNLWITKKIIDSIPEKSTIHLGILNTLRCWNYIGNNKKLNVYCNTGGFGIDGMLSTLIGASLCDKSKNYFGVVGDLAFFYDMNSLGNRYIGNNLRIILVNNGCGTEFHNYSHPASVIGDDNISSFIAANGHFGNKSKNLVKNYAENLGFEYISANNKDEFLNNINYFTSDKLLNKPIIFEIFTNSDEESDALFKIRNIKSTPSGTIMRKIKNTLSPETKNKIKKVIKR